MFIGLLSLLATVSDLTAQQESFFYRGIRYGSEGSFNPLELVLNNAWGINAATSRGNRMSDVKYREGFDNVWENVSNPVIHLRRYGWWNFVRDEMLPSSLKINNGQWWPNYTNHLLGGGMMYRRTAEWYEYNSFPHPQVLAFLTMEVMHFTNEIVENSGYKGTNADPIADILIFDQLGMLLFSSERVSRFFSGRLNMADWSLQPMINISTGELENAAQNYTIKVPLSSRNRTYLFYHWGNNGILGASFKRDKDRFISIGGGLTVKDLKELNDEGEIRKVTTDLVWTAALFYDREGSLLASLILSGTKRYRALLNIYPGVIALWRFEPGIFAALGKEGSMMIGVRLRWLPLGVSGK